MDTIFEGYTRRTSRIAFIDTMQHLLCSPDWAVLLSPDEVMTGYDQGLITSRVLRILLCD
jgi:hypothetical protein